MRFYVLVGLLIAYILKNYKFEDGHNFDDQVVVFKSIFRCETMFLVRLMLFFKSIFVLFPYISTNYSLPDTNRIENLHILITT